MILSHIFWWFLSIILVIFSQYLVILSNGSVILSNIFLWFLRSILVILWKFKVNMSNMTNMLFHIIFNNIHMITYNFPKSFFLFRSLLMLWQSVLVKFVSFISLLHRSVQVTFIGSGSVWSWFVSMIHSIFSDLGAVCSASGFSKKGLIFPNFRLSKFPPKVNFPTLLLVK